MKRTSNLLSLKRNKIFEAIGVLTGHWLFGKYGNKLGIITSQSYSFCGGTDVGETTEHFLGLCPALASLRLKTLGTYFFEENLGPNMLKMK